MSNKKLSVIIGAIDKLSGPVKKINANIERMRAPFDEVNRSVNTLKRNVGLRKFNRDLKKSVRHAKNASRAIGGLVKKVGFLAAAGGGAMYAFAKKYADAGDNIAKTSHRLGIGVQKLQELRFAADRSGVSVAAFDKTVLRFSGVAGEAARGVGEGAKAFDDLGISFKDQNGNLRSTEAVFVDTLRALEKIENPLQRNSYAMKLFGTRGTEVVQMTKDGAGGLEKMQKEFRDLSYSISEEAAKSAEAFTDKSTNLGTVLSGLSNRIGEKLIPALNPLIDRLIELSLSVGPKVSEWADGFAKDLPGHLEKLFDGLKRVWDVLKWLSDTFGLINIAVGAFALIIGASLVSAITTLSSAFFALGAAILTTPIGWFIGVAAVLVGVGVAIYKNWDSITAAFKKFGSFLTTSSPIALLIGDVKSLFSEFDGLWGFLKSFFGFLVKVNPFALMLRSMNALIKTFTGFDVLSTITEKLQNLLPDWALKLLSSDAQNSAPKSAAAMAPIPNQRAQFDGKLRVQVDSEGRARVKEVRGDNPNMDVVVDVGPAMAGA